MQRSPVDIGHMYALHIASAPSGHEQVLASLGSLGYSGDSNPMAKIAIIETGGKQYVVTQDSVLDIEKLKGTDKVGAKITFDKVLLTDDGAKTVVGTPYIKGAEVAAELVENGRAQKVTIIRYRQKSRYSKKRGHRQPFAKVRITALP